MFSISLWREDICDEVRVDTPNPKKKIPSSQSAEGGGKVLVRETTKELAYLQGTLSSLDLVAYQLQYDAGHHKPDRIQGIVDTEY
jgi:hypothetical protein